MSGRPAVKARIGSEAGPSRIVRPWSAYCWSTGQATIGGPPAAVAWAADTIRHSRPHPDRSWASSVILSGASATCAPPRTGVRTLAA